MMNYNNFQPNMMFPSAHPGVFIAVMLWSLFWKALALWHSARRGQPVWFGALLVVNSVGILEIIYLFAVAKLTFDTLFTMAKKKK